MTCKIHYCHSLTQNSGFENQSVQGYLKIVRTVPHGQSQFLIKLTLRVF